MMKKIVIISEQRRVNHELIALLTALFPECDISIVAADTQDFEPCPAGSYSNFAKPSFEYLLNFDDKES